ncbi:hypothetical protein D3C71_1495620 [compost metagenome]
MDVVRQRVDRLGQPENIAQLRERRAHRLAGVGVQGIEGTREIGGEAVEVLGARDDGSGDEHAAHLQRDADAFDLAAVVHQVDQKLQEGVRAGGDGGALAEGGVDAHGRDLR